MALQHLANIGLTAHVKEGGFDRAAIHDTTACLYVAYTAYDALYRG